MIENDIDGEGRDSDCCSVLISHSGWGMRPADSPHQHHDYQAHLARSLAKSVEPAPEPKVQEPALLRRLQTLVEAAGRRRSCATCLVSGQREGHGGLRLPWRHRGGAATAQPGGSGCRDDACGCKGSTVAQVAQDRCRARWVDGGRGRIDHADVIQEGYARPTGIPVCAACSGGALVHAYRDGAVCDPPWGYRCREWALSKGCIHAPGDAAVVGFSVEGDAEMHHQSVIVNVNDLLAISIRDFDNSG